MVIQRNNCCCTYYNSVRRNATQCNTFNLEFFGAIGPSYTQHTGCNALQEKHNGKSHEIPIWEEGYT